MKDYEKLVLFLEMQNIDVSPFLKLKKNELALNGAFEIFNKNSYKEVLFEKQTTDLYKDNAFFMALGKMKYSKKLSEMLIFNYKSKQPMTIKEVFDDESLTDQEKNEVIFKGIERANSEYKRFISYHTINNQTVLKDYSKLFEDKKMDLKRNQLIKKNIFLFYLIALILIGIDLLFLQNSYLNEKGFFVGIYNSFVFLLIVIPLIKRLYLNYFSNRVSIQNQRINRFFSKCDLLLNVNDKNFSKLEKDLYRYSTGNSKDKSIVYLQNSNKVLKKLDRKVELIFRLNSLHVGDKVFTMMIKVINLLPIIGLSLLLLFSLV